MVECPVQQNEDGDWVCGWDEDDDFCTGYHCDNCLISLCSSECGDEYCARTRSPADKENNQCMMCAHPLEDEEYDMELDTWVKDGKTIEWESASKFSYPCEECGIDPCDCMDYGKETGMGGAIYQQTRHFGRKLRKGAEGERTPELQAYYDEQKKKDDFRYGLGAKYPQNCTFCMVAIHKGLEDGSVTQAEYDEWMNDPDFPTLYDCARHNYRAEDEGKTRTFKVLSVDYETDDEVDNDDLPQEFTITLDGSDMKHLEQMEKEYNEEYPGEWPDYEMQEIADLMVDTISDESGWLVEGFYFEELMPDGSLKSFDAEKVVSWICDECGNDYHTEDEAEECRCKTADWTYKQDLLEGTPALAGRIGWSDIVCSNCGDFESVETEIIPEKCPSCNYWMNAEGLEFTDWAKQETKHHGKKTSLKDWADHEIKTHGGKMSFQDWAKHEDKSHIDRYGAERVFMGWKQFYQMHLDDGMDNSKNQIGNLWNRVKDMGYCPCDRCSKAYYGAEGEPEPYEKIWDDYPEPLEDWEIDALQRDLPPREVALDEGTYEWIQENTTEDAFDGIISHITHWFNKYQKCKDREQGQFGAESIEVWEMIQQNLNNPDAVREFYRVLVGDPDDFTGDDMALVVAEVYQQNDNSQEFVDWVHKELFSAEEVEECEYCGTKEEEELTEIREDSLDGPRVLICDHCYDIARYGAESISDEDRLKSVSVVTGCGCKVNKPLTKEERTEIHEQIEKFNHQLMLDPNDEEYERYILIDFDDEGLIEDAFFHHHKWKPLTETFRKRWGERAKLMDKISQAQVGEDSNWSSYSLERPFWFDYECDSKDTATAEDPEGYGLGFEFDLTKEEAIEKARQIHKETKGAITMYNNARKTKKDGTSTRIHPKFWATPEMMEQQKEYYKREWMEWPSAEWLNEDEYERIYGKDAEELKRDSCCCGATKTNPCACMIQGIMKCSATCPCSLEKKGAENWGGDPKGKLAQALAKARKKVGKTLKIEKLGAEEVNRVCNICNEIKPTRAYQFGRFLGMYEPTQYYVRDYCDPCAESDGLTITKDAEGIGQWEIGEQLEEAQMNAESFEAQAPRGHKMMTAALGKKIPPMDSQEGMGDEAIVYAHYFNPYGMGEWWILEWDGKDEMFGYADLGFPELGYISLSELENVSIGGMELPIERDLHWREKTLGEVKQAVSKYRAESLGMGFEYYYLIDAHGNRSNNFPTLEEVQIARSYVPNRNLKIMRRRFEGRNMVGKTTEVTEFDPYKNPNYFKTHYHGEGTMAAESFGAEDEQINIDGQPYTVALGYNYIDNKQGKVGLDYFGLAHNEKDIEGLEKLAIETGKEESEKGEIVSMFLEWEPYCSHGSDNPMGCSDCDRKRGYGDNEYVTQYITPCVKCGEDILDSHFGNSESSLFDLDIYVDNLGKYGKKGNLVHLCCANSDDVTDTLIQPV